MARQPHRPLPLRKHWPRRVRSATVHAIALPTGPNHGPLPGRDDLCQGRTSTCWNNEPFTAHLVQYRGQESLTQYRLQHLQSHRGLGCSAEADERHGQLPENRAGWQVPVPVARSKPKESRPYEPS